MSATFADAAWRRIAASAYRAYASSIGKPMPAFKGLPGTIQTAWEEAAKEAVLSWSKTVPEAMT